jgi:hypothetical protein
MANLLIKFIVLYRKIAHRLVGCRCRYYPSCSCYAEEAIGKHGLIVGLFLALLRLIRCNQYFPGGFDPVPVKPTKFGEFLLKT